MQSLDSYSDAEYYIIQFYLTFCSTLDITLNVFTFFLLITKVKISRCPACIPFLPLSVLGMLYGLTSTLMITISFYGKTMIGSRMWCHLTVTIQNHTLISYIANICIIAIEASYAISHRFTYMPGHSLIYLIISCSVTLFIPVPISVAYWLFLEDDPPMEADNGGHFYFNTRLKQCVRFWDYGSEASTLYLTISILYYLAFIILTIISVVIVVIYIEKSKTEFHRSTFQDSKARKRAQDVKTAKSAVVLCLVSSVPWLPGIFSVVLLAVVGDKAHRDTHGLYETALWTTHSLYWLLPLVALNRNTALNRAFHCFKMDLTKLIRRFSN